METAVTRRLGMSVPVVQAPMGGGPSTVELAAAVSNAGGLGTLAGGYLSPSRLRHEIRQLREASQGRFAVNLFIPTPVAVDSRLAETVEVLRPYRAELGLPADPTPDRWGEDFDDQLAVLIDEKIPVFSFTFGLLPEDAIRAFRRTGTVLIGTATNVAEALALEASGVDIVCVQGGEAGGHHGSWMTDSERSVIGTVALVPMVCDTVGIPVIAAGGVMDSRGVAAVLCLGAGAAQMGTAFMLCPEAGTVDPHREAMKMARDTDVLLTSEVTGRLARGVRNRLMDELRGRRVPPYPIMNSLTREIRSASAARNDPELMSLWCGQAVPLASEQPAAEIVAAIRSGVERLASDLLGANATSSP